MFQVTPAAKRNCITKLLCRFIRCSSESLILGFKLHKTVEILRIWTWGVTVLWLSYTWSCFHIWAIHQVILKWTCKTHKEKKHIDSSEANECKVRDTNFFGLWSVTQDMGIKVQKPMIVKSVVTTARDCSTSLAHRRCLFFSSAILCQSADVGLLAQRYHVQFIFSYKYFQINFS